MKYTKTVLAATFGLSLCVQQAVALPIDVPTYQDIDSFLVTLNALNPSASGTFDIRDRPSDGSPAVRIATGGRALGNQYLNAGQTYTDILGFEPGFLERIVEANAYFYLRNANGDSDVYEVDLTGFVTGSVEGGGNFSRFILGGSLGSVALNMLNDNGYLDYTVERESGAFTFDYAQLQVVLTVPGGTPPGGVPDGGSTLMLLGCALMGLGTVTRRL
jgi:hypothetical protein